LGFGIGYFAVPQFQSQSVNNLGDLYLINYDLQTRPAAPVLFDNITWLIAPGATNATINYTMSAQPVLFSQPFFTWDAGYYSIPITNITSTNFILYWQNATPVTGGEVFIVLFA
jgi:hypothetical protein